MSERDDVIHRLSLIIHDHPTMTGAEFQRFCLEAAAAFYGAEDLDDYVCADELLAELHSAAESHPLTFRGTKMVHPSKNMGKL